MSRSIDNPERRAAVRGSAEIAAAKHLARAYGVSMRRRRRVGAVVYDLGSSGAPRAHGSLTFTDAGVLHSAHLFGGDVDLIPAERLLALARVLEHGPAQEATELVTTLVVEEDVATGPIQIVASTVVAVLPAAEVEPALIEPAVVLEAPTAIAFVDETSPSTVSVPIPIVLTMPERSPGYSLHELQQEVLEAFPARARLWAWFFLGVLLVFQAVALLLVAASSIEVPVFAWVGSALVALAGLGVLGGAIGANDRRLAAYRAVGL
jgi:hypothetical protein